MLTVPSSSMIATVAVSELMVTDKQVINLIIIVNVLFPSCIMLSIMSTSNDDDLFPAVIVTL